MITYELQFLCEGPARGATGSRCLHETTYVRTIFVSKRMDRWTERYCPLNAHLRSKSRITSVNGEHIVCKYSGLCGNCFSSLSRDPFGRKRPEYMTWGSISLEYVTFQDDPQSVEDVSVPIGLKMEETDYIYYFERDPSQNAP